MTIQDLQNNHPELHKQAFLAGSRSIKTRVKSKMVYADHFPDATADALKTIKSEIDFY
ncbi:hypothetical protein [Leeuwenhoekiella blandensis]|uniref:hypothetical protein n=1 Tax=Leeuwenhoekiella blandensis TaxID=360293 RepID=UPI002354A307|nr:hypothetical protein [Leeuwenhoekiella blandensis]|tara:strand:- start:2125 stop:2298 length:174 start_codon:yes stop_codon:yes gene_type:complete